MRLRAARSALLLASATAPRARMTSAPMHGINNARAGAYADRLERFDPSVALGPRSMQLTLGGTF